MSNALTGKPLEINRNIGWDLVYVKDVADAVVQSFQALDRRTYDIFNIGSGIETNVEELAQLVIHEAGSKSQVFLHPDFRKKVASHFYFDISKARKLLGFRPLALQDGIKECIKALQAESSS